MSVCDLVHHNIDSAVNYKGLEIPFVSIFAITFCKTQLSAGDRSFNCSHANMAQGKAGTSSRVESNAKVGVLPKTKQNNKKRMDGLTMTKVSRQVFMWPSSVGLCEGDITQTEMGMWLL